METIYGVKELTKKINYPVATIGMFDGVHRGHQKIIETIRHYALEKKGESLIITFDRHPKNIIENRPPSFITSMEHRLVLLERLGVDHAVVLNFDQKLAAQPQLRREKGWHRIRRPNPLPRRTALPRLRGS